MHIIGTAGHVDHGKSALVRALTGMEPGRGVDLGFAHLRFDDGVEAGLVDVPGHERFLHNMLAGAAGMEIVLLVVAANAGVKPQTLEHLAILRCLNVRRALLVLSKSDTVDDDERAAAIVRLAITLRGTIARDAPVYPVSSISGAGLPALRSAIHDALRALPERAPEASAYLPIDRVFALAGHGTIVTGTLMQGRIAVGDTLALWPAMRSVRVRSLQVFGENRNVVGGGTRVAISILGIDTAQIARGAVLAAPTLESTDRYRVAFDALPDARVLFKRRTAVRAYIGAAEILATLILDELPSGERSTCTAGTLLLRTATVAAPGTPFVVRHVSAMTLLGGGTIVDSPVFVEPSAPVKEYEFGAILAALERISLSGSTAAQIAAAVNLSDEQVATRLATLVANRRIVVLRRPPAYMSATVAQDLLARVVAVLHERQREYPWRMGVPSVALGQALELPEAVLMRALGPAIEAGTLVYQHGYYATPDFSPQLSAEQRLFFDRALKPDPASPDAPVPAEQFFALMQRSGVVETSNAFETLITTGRLAKVGAFIYRGTQIAQIRTQLEDALNNGAPITVAQFRDLTGTSRKYAVPLLEYFDAIGVTLRSGDTRVLRQSTVRNRA